MSLKDESQHQDSRKKQSSTSDVADFTWKPENCLSYRYKTTRQLHA